MEQYREPVHTRVIEFPAGLVNDDPKHENETIEQAAKREFLEETGYLGRVFKRLITGPVSPGLTSETVTYVRGYDLTREEEGGGCDDESIIVHKIPCSEIDNWLMKSYSEGKTIDAKIYTGLYLLRVGKTPTDIQYLVHDGFGTQV